MMRKYVVMVMAVLFLAFPSLSFASRHSVPRYLHKETTVDMSKSTRIFVDWVDLHEDDWGMHGYTTKDEWVNVIASLNSSFDSNLITKYLTGYTVVPAKNKDDHNAKDCDLMITFSDVRVDYNNYHLILCHPLH
jgi:hypothetical protein